MGGAVFPPCSLAGGQIMIGVHCWSMPPLKMPVCLLWGHCSFLLGPGVHKVLLCLLRVCFSSSVIKSHWPSKSDFLGVLSPFAGSTGWEICLGPRTFATVQELLWYNCSPVCESSAPWLCSGINDNLLQGDLCHMLYFLGLLQQSTCPRSRPLWPMPLQETLKHSKAGLAQSLAEVTVPFPGSWCAQGSFAPSESFWWVWDLILKVIAHLLQSCWGFWFALGHGVSLFGGIQHSPVKGCSAASWDFGVLQISTCPSTLPTC